ncbi:MAG: peptide ABC transporter substrate-binding protein [Planctomycetes bacterium]|nr:peptide ABC transporter substrate-binding protein [Planctomycetota bacterium]
MRGLLAIIAVLLALGCVLPWATHTAAPAGAPVIALSLPRTIDPCMATRLDEFRLITALFEPLVRLDARTLQPKPALAERWEFNADQSVWTFHLDRRARWHDGKPVVAADIRRGLLRHLITQSPNAFYLDGLLKGAASTRTNLNERRVILERDCGLRCPDDHTLVVELAHPAPYLTAILSLSAFVPLRAEQDMDDDHARRAWTDPTTVIGNGPFRCTGYTPRHHYDFTPSATYGGAHPAKGPVRALVVDSPGTALRLYLSGEVDAILLLASDTVGDLKRKQIAGLHQSPSLSTAFLRVRIVPRPNDRTEVTRALQHPRLRRALATGLDRRAISDHLMQGNAIPATTFVPAALGDYLPYRAPVAVLADHIEQAKADIAAAKADLGTLPELELVAPSQPAERQSAAELVADQWRRHLGITVKLTILPQTELRSREKAIDYDLSYAVWLGDFLDPTTFLDCFRIDGGANRTGFADPEYDRLLNLASASIGDTRWKALEAAEQRLVEAVPLIPLCHTACSFLVRPGLEGITANPLEIVNFDDVGWPAKP